MMENKTKIDLKNKSIFITGVAGFIGSNLAKRLLSTVEGVKVVGLDNMNHYYDVRLKEARLNELEQFENFSFVKGNLADKAVIESIFEQYKPEIVVNLGAQAGVRYSITNPDAYVEANLIGFYNILEACRHSYDEGHTPVEHLVYASSSSVYERRLKSVEEHLKMLEQEEQKYQTLRRQLYEDMSSGIVSKEEYKEFSHSFNEKVEAIRKAKAEMNRQRDCLNNLDVEHLPWIEDFKSYQNLTSLNRRVLVELVESITVYDKEHIHIQYRFDQEIRNVLEYCSSVPAAETEESAV